MPYARIKAKYRNSGNNFSTFQFNPSGSLSTLNELLEDFNNSIEKKHKNYSIFFHNSIEEIIKTCSMHYSSEFQKCSLILKTDFLKKRYSEGVFLFLFLYRQGTVRHNSQYQHRSKIKDKENVHFQEKELLLSEQFFFFLLSGIEKAVRTRCSKAHSHTTLKRFF